MAELAVKFLLDQLSPFLLQKAELLGRVREDAEHIRDELERMKAFLRVADAKEESVPELHVWVKQVRDVAYDTEDVLDEFVLRFGHHHGDGFYGSLRKIACFIKTLRARYRISREIQRIKSRMVSISEGHQRYSGMYSSLQEHGSTSTAVVDASLYDPRGDALLLEEAELVGIEQPKTQLIEWLVFEGGTKLKSVSVWGMGGLGKTTLVKQVYDDAAVKKHFESHAWLTVSESFRVEDLLKDMIQQLFSEIQQPTPQGVENMDINKLKGIIKYFLQQRRYVVVFDDVWQINAWEAIKYMLPDNNCGSRVILTTRFANIAITSCKEIGGNIYALEALSPKESWILFCKKTFGGNSCPPHLKKISLAILKRCEGLPLAIVAVSGILATKDRIDEWEMLYHSLGAELEDNDQLERVKKVLSLSYNDLPSHLKICFLYLGIFPEDHEIEWMRLVRLWTAEGFVNATEGKTKEEVAGDYLNDLINRSLVQVANASTDGRPKTCRIHDLMREIILSKSKKHDIVTIVRGPVTSWPEKVRRLTIHRTAKDVKYSECFYRLRSLVVLEAVDSLPILSSLVGLLSGGSRLLKVLDLRGIPTLETLPDEVFKLFYLRYLSLRGTKVKVVPKLIGKLENLETLDLKSTYVTELPVEILRLQKLRSLLLYRYDTGSFYLPFHSIHGFTAPYEIGSLQSLQKLSFVEADQIIGNGTSSIVRELGRLTQLRRLGIVKLRREDGVTLCSSIEKLSSLRSLDVTSIEEDEILDLQSVSLAAAAPRFLQRVYLWGRLEKLPPWITSLQSLVKLRLRWNKLRDDPLQPLQDLPYLVELSLDQAYEGTELRFKAGGFQRLKILWLIRLKRLRWVRMGECTMPRLEELYIRDCELMEEVPSGIHLLTNLKYVGFTDMSNKLISKLDPEVEGGDYWKIEHIPRVAVGDTKHGHWQLARQVFMKSK